jgi:hypothetical protein
MMMANGMKIVRRGVLVGVAAALAAGLAGCGYSSKPLFTTAYKTVHVPIFGNKTFRKQLEMRLTEAVAKNIEARTPYKVVGDPKQADTILQGTIVDVPEGVLTRRYGTNLPRETEVLISANVLWKDPRTGRVLIQRQQIVREATDIPQLGEHVWDAEQRAIEELAYAIVSQMQKDF